MQESDTRSAFAVLCGHLREAGSGHETPGLIGLVAAQAGCLVRSNTRANRRESEARWIIRPAVNPADCSTRFEKDSTVRKSNTTIAAALAACSSAAVAAGQVPEFGRKDGGNTDQIAARLTKALGDVQEF